MNQRLLVLADATSIHTQKWLEGLNQVGDWDIYLISMNPGETRTKIAEIPRVKEIHRIAPARINAAGGNFQYFFNIFKIRRLIRQVNPEAISTLYLSSYGFMGALLKGRAKLIHCVLGTDIMIFPSKGRVFRWIAQFSLSRADFVISLSQAMTQRLTGMLRYNKDKILTQSYGVSDDILAFPQFSKTIDLVSNRAWITNSNIDYFLSILAQVRPSKAVVVGGTVGGFEALAQKINLEAVKLSCAVIPPLPNLANIELVASSHFLVSLTSSDGSSVSLLEAMAVGTIPILSDIAANREWVTHAENGFLVPLNNLPLAVQIFNQALNLSPTARLTMAARNKEIAADRGSLSRNMGRVAQILRNLLKGSDVLPQNTVNQSKSRQVDQRT